MVPQGFKTTVPHRTSRGRNEGWYYLELVASNYLFRSRALCHKNTPVLGIKTLEGEICDD